MTQQDTQSPVKVVITGWQGLLGFHFRALLTALNCQCEFSGQEARFDIHYSPRLVCDNAEELASALKDAQLVVHIAGVNRAEPEVVEQANDEMAAVLVSALHSASSSAQLVYTNSTHCDRDTAYGRGKEAANQRFVAWSETHGTQYSNLILPHVFGERAKPFYNNVTATLCQQIVDGDVPTIHEGAAVELVHAGDVADEILAIYESNRAGSIRMSGQAIAVQELHALLKGFDDHISRNVFPDFSDAFHVKLFNTFRWFKFPTQFPGQLQLHEDNRGVLFEAVKGGGGGQSFLSWTNPGIERGNHFHRSKVERFLVVSGEADIQVRELFSDEVHTFKVTGEAPVYVDMPTLHTHNIRNTGTEPLLTMFWSHEIFDPEHPDTYAHNVNL